MPRTLVLILMGAMLGGCSHLHVDEQGRRHVVGLVWLTLPPERAAQPTGADAVRVRGLGLVVTRSPAGSGIVLGYGDSTVTVIRNDALVHLPTEEVR